MESEIEFLLAPLLTFSRGAFPRRFGTKERWKQFVADMPDFFQKFLSIRKTVDCYLSVYSYNQMKTEIIDTIMFEYDVPYLDSRTKQMQIILEMHNYIVEMLQKHNYTARMYWTAGKGEHVYLDTPDIFVPINGIHQMIEDFLENIGILEVLDTSVIGDYGRMARIPYSVNTKTGEMMKAVPFVILDDISQFYDDYHITERGSNDHIVKDLIVGRKSKPNPKITYVEPIGEPPCITEALRQLKEEGWTFHENRTNIGSFFLQKGKSINEIAAMFAVAKDHKPYKTKKALVWLKDRDYKPYSCKRAKKLYDKYNRCMCPVEGMCDYILQSRRGNLDVQMAIQ
jgi:hypothetical protein